MFITALELKVVKKLSKLCPHVVAEAYFPFVNKRCHFLTVDAIIGNQAFQNGRCHIGFSSGLDKVETGYSLLME